MMEKDIIIVINEKKGFMDKTFDTLSNAGYKYTYLIDEFNKILVDANYFAFRNKLNRIFEETKGRYKLGIKEPVVVLFDEFDRMCTVPCIHRMMEELFVPFVNRMPVPVKVYIRASTYEMCRNRTCLLPSGELKVLSDYEEWRQIVMS